VSNKKIAESLGISLSASIGSAIDAPVNSPMIYRGRYQWLEYCQIRVLLGRRNLESSSSMTKQNWLVVIMYIAKEASYFIFVL